MLCKTVLCAAALSAGVAADFMVYTTPPIPSDAVPTFSDSSQSASWTTMIVFNAEIAYQDYTQAMGSTWESSLSSASSEMSNWVASSASNFSIPSAVTDPETTTSMFSKPDWYTALPSKVRQFKELQVSDQFSVVRDVISRHAPTSGSSGAAALPTPRAGLGAGFGAMAAVAAGVFL